MMPIQFAVLLFFILFSIGSTTVAIDNSYNSGNDFLLKTYQDKLAKLVEETGENERVIGSSGVKQPTQAKKVPGYIDNKEEIISLLEEIKELLSAGDEENEMPINAIGGSGRSFVGQNGGPESANESAANDTDTDSVAVAAEETEEQPEPEPHKEIVKQRFNVEERFDDDEGYHYHVDGVEEPDVVSSAPATNEIVESVIGQEERRIGSVLPEQAFRRKGKGMVVEAAAPDAESEENKEKKEDEEEKEEKSDGKTKIRLRKKNISTSDSITLTVALVAGICVAAFIIFATIQWRRTLNMIKLEQISSTENLRTIRNDLRKMTSRNSSMQSIVIEPERIP